MVEVVRCEVSCSDLVDYCMCSMRSVPSVCEECYDETADPRNG